MSKKIHAKLTKLANKYSPKIVCGFLVGKREENRMIVEEYYVLLTASNPKTHFKPNWSAYRSTANIIHEEKDNHRRVSHTSRWQ